MISSAVFVISVLPKFEVNLDVPSVHYHEDTLVGTVNAR